MFFNIFSSSTSFLSAIQFFSIFENSFKEAPRAYLPPAYGYDVYPRWPPGVAQMKVHRVLYRIPRFKIWIWVQIFFNGGFKNVIY